jgi:hypothetical protein
MTLSEDLIRVGCEPRISDTRRDTLRRRSRGVGLLIVIAGSAWGAQVVTGVDVDRHWPLALVIAGASLWAIGGLVRNPGRQWMVIVGAAATMTGGILSYQVISGRWESWWYAWPLVVPFSLGVAVLACSALEWAPRHAWRLAVRLIVSGAFLFTLLLLVFEGLLGIGGHAMEGRWPLVVPLLVVLAGAVLAIWPRNHEKRFGASPKKAAA